MEWKDAPDQPGWWWVCDRDYPVYVSNVTGKTRVSEPFAGDLYLSTFQKRHPNARWLGPIQPPEPPKG